jgi:hypothetical protein
VGLVQPLGFKPGENDWDSWMMALSTWAQNIDTITAGLPVTKQGITNLMQMSASTSDAFLMYYVNALPTSGTFANQVVFNGEDGRIYYWDANSQLWVPTGSTSFNQIEGFVQPSQLLLGNQLNIVTNGSFTNDTVGGPPNGWSTTSSYSNAPVTVVAGTQAVAGCPTSNCVFLQGRDTYFTSGGGFDVGPNEFYFLEGYVGSDGTTPGMQIGLYFPAVGSNGPTWLGAFQSPAGQNGWALGDGVLQVPSWANRAQVWLQVNAIGGTPASYGNNWMTGIECVKTSSRIVVGSANQVSCPSGVNTTILSGSFYTTSFSLVIAKCFLESGNSGADNIHFLGNLNIDGTPAGGTNDWALTCAGSIAWEIIDIVTTRGSHTYTVTVDNLMPDTCTASVDNLMILDLTA